MLKVVLKGCDYCSNICAWLATVWDNDDNKKRLCCRECYQDSWEIRYE